MGGEISEVRGSEFELIRSRVALFIFRLSPLFLARDSQTILPSDSQTRISKPDPQLSIAPPSTKHHCILPGDV